MASAKEAEAMLHASQQAAMYIDVYASVPVVYASELSLVLLFTHITNAATATTAAVDCGM